jgi:hypothetical protein
VKNPRLQPIKTGIFCRDEKQALSRPCKNYFCNDWLGPKNNTDNVCSGDRMNNDPLTAEWK